MVTAFGDMGLDNTVNISQPPPLYDNRVTFNHVCQVNWGRQMTSHVIVDVRWVGLIGIWEGLYRLVEAPPCGIRIKRGHAPITDWEVSGEHIVNIRLLDYVS